MNTVVREVSAQEVTQEVRLPEGMADIGRVLCAWGQMIIRSKEWRGDTVTAAGGVMVWVLYAPEDGTDPQCIDAWIPYQLRWDRLEAEREGPVRISPLLRFVDARTLSARKIMVRAGAAAVAEALVPGQSQLYTPEEVPEDVELLRRTYPVRIPKEAGEKTFQMEEELNHSGPEIAHIISYSLQPDLSDNRVLANKLVFRGSGKLHLVYRCKEGRIRTSDFEIPFSQYAQLDQSHSPDARGDIWFGITLLELDLDDAGRLHLKCGLVAQYLVDDRELIELVEDAYSPRRMVETQQEMLRLPVILEDRADILTAESSAAGHRGDVIDVSFLPDFPRQKRTQAGVELEIPGVFQTLYYGEDGMLQSTGSRWEKRILIPAGESSKIDAFILPGESAQAVNGAEGFELSGQMMSRCRTTGAEGIPMVTGLKIGEQLEPTQGCPSLILCRPEGETLWSIAKRCGSTMAAIQQANGIQETFPENRMLLIPVCR